METQEADFLVPLLIDVKDYGFCLSRDAALERIRSRLSPSSQSKFKAIYAQMLRRHSYVNCSHLSPTPCDSPYPCPDEIDAADMRVDQDEIYLYKSASVIDSSRYELSPAQSELRKTTLTMPDGAALEEWERIVFRSILRYARRLAIVDPYASKSFDSFEASLKWLTDMINRLSLQLSIRKLVTVRSAAKAAGLEAWCKKNDFQLVYQKNFHTRYLLSDSFGLNVERGFQLMKSDRTVHRCEISLMQQEAAQKVWYELVERD